MIAFNDISLAYIASSYYDMSSFTKFIIEASQYKPIVFKGNILMVFAGLWIVSQILFIINAGKYKI